MSTMLKIDITL